MLNVKNCDFLFLIEHEDREANPVRLICDNLAKLGYDCIILSLEFHVHKLANINPKAVVVPYAFNSEQWPLNYLTVLYRLDTVWFSLSWEQLLTPINMHYKKPCDIFVRETMYHLAWADNFKKFLTDNKVLEGQVTVIGNVAHEILEIQSLDPAAVKGELAKEYGLSNDSTWVFMPMNYAWAFSTDATIEAKIAKGYDDINAWKYRDYAKACINKFTQFITEFSLANPSMNFIVRPHPSISVEQYKQVFINNKLPVPSNVIFSKNHTIREWIVASDIVGSSWSSSVWDAVQSGKKGFLYTPLPKPDWHKVWWEEKVCNVTQYKELDLSALVVQATELSSKGVAVNTAKWMSEKIKKGKVTKPRIRRTITVSNIVLRRIRSFLRCYSMEYLGGIGVSKGLQRDYLEPIHYSIRND